jgi:UDP-N-acetylmuramate dehydrogenase
MEIKKAFLKNYSSLRVGGEGFVVEVFELRELIEALMYARKENLRIQIIGEGTNTFFADALSGILCIVVKNKGISLEEKEDVSLLTAAAGEMFDNVVKFSVEQKLWGIENLSHIPGTVGASPIQNIGAYGVEFKDVLVSLQAVNVKTLDVVTISKEACRFGYRDSLFKQEPGKYVIISVTLALSRTKKPVLTYKPLGVLLEKENCIPSDVRELVVSTRKSKLPDYREYPNVGSFFKNPLVPLEKGDALKVLFPEIPCIPCLEGYKIPAAWLIEHVACMKGVRVGDVGTWPNQPLVLVNYGAATCEEVMLFSDSIIEKIREKTGIVLEREVNLVKE